jgi:hypothetical protein
MTTIINGSSPSITFSDTTTQSTAATGFDVGTRLMFAQTAAPTGWTKDTTNYNNHALRVVTGAASTGGSVDFTTAFASGLSDSAVTLSTAQMPSHTHSFTVYSANGGSLPKGYGTCSGSSFNTDSTGGGGSHTHTLPSFAVKYLDVITATKN